jgi:hypothetical protein
LADDILAERTAGRHKRQTVGMIPPQVRGAFGDVAFRISKNLLAGSLFVAVGAGVLSQALTYQVGTATNMGPGYFPAALAIV